MLKAVIEIPLELIHYPLDPPTKPNCEKCVCYKFCREWITSGFHLPESCGYGRNGYFNSSSGILEYSTGEIVYGSNN